jgi:hypothetical protein
VSSFTARAAIGPGCCDTKPSFSAPEQGGTKLVKETGERSDLPDRAIAPLERYRQCRPGLGEKSRAL